MGSGIGISGVILLVLIALLLFGPSKLPELGRAFGRTLREFKRGASGLMDDEPESIAKRADDRSMHEKDPPAEERRLPE